MIALRIPKLLDRPRPPVPSFRGRTERSLLGKELTDSLRQLGRAHGATLYMKKVTVSSTIGPGIPVDQATLSF